MSLNDRETKWSKEIKWSKWYLSKNPLWSRLTLSIKLGGKKYKNKNTLQEW